MDDAKPNTRRPWNDCNADTRPFYTAIEAAVRWCGLIEREAEITKAISEDPRARFPDWPCLRPRIDELRYAMRNEKLPYGIDGNPRFNSGERRSETRWTIDHHDLAAWMTEYYPDEKPPFLFGAAARSDDTEPDPRHRKTLLRTIAALLDLLEIDPDEPPKTTAHAVNAKLELKNRGMKPETIAAVIKAAREID